MVTSQRSSSLFNIWSIHLSVFIAIWRSNFPKLFFNIIVSNLLAFRSVDWSGRMTTANWHLVEMIIEYARHACFMFNYFKKKRMALDWIFSWIAFCMEQPFNTTCAEILWAHCCCKSNCMVTPSSWTSCFWWWHSWPMYSFLEYCH